MKGNAHRTMRSETHNTENKQTAKRIVANKYDIERDKKSGKTSIFFSKTDGTKQKYDA